MFWKKKPPVKKKAAPAPKAVKKVVPVKAAPAPSAPLKKSKTTRKILTAEGWKRLMMKKTGKK